MATFTRDDLLPGGRLDMSDQPTPSRRTRRQRLTDDDIASEAKAHGWSAEWEAVVRAELEEHDRTPVEESIDTWLAAQRAPWRQQ